MVWWGGVVVASSVGGVVGGGRAQAGFFKGGTGDSALTGDLPLRNLAGGFNSDQRPGTKNYDGRSLRKEADRLGGLGETCWGGSLEKRGGKGKKIWGTFARGAGWEVGGRLMWWEKRIANCRAVKILN